GTYSKTEGRVGDSPIIGSGTWADQHIAVSCTGLGEYFCRANAAHAIAAKIEYGAMTLNDACQTTLAKIADLGGDGGLIAVNRSGAITMPYNSYGMRRASASSTSEDFVAIFE
ncbi:MAG: isoaspartyl peptidase/L-asparaginase, partial [Pseudomonadota bacterium]